MGRVIVQKWAGTARQLGEVPGGTFGGGGAKKMLEHPTMMRHIFSESSPFLPKIYFCDAFCFLFFLIIIRALLDASGWEKSKSERRENCMELRALISSRVRAHFGGSKEKMFLWFFRVSDKEGWSGGAGKSVKWKRFPGNFFGWNWFLHLGGERDLFDFIFYLFVSNFCKKLRWSSGKMVELGKETFIFLKITIFWKWNRERKMKEWEFFPFQMILILHIIYFQCMIHTFY